jgi:hypothetical protein
VVAAKTLEIRELSSVTCSGVARDNQALEGARPIAATRDIGNLKVDQIRGKTRCSSRSTFTGEKEAAMPLRIASKFWPSLPPSESGCSSETG